METPEVEETKGFWKTNKELLLSTVIIMAVMLVLKYLFKMALEYHIS
jgi:hypothetical protein